MGKMKTEKKSRRGLTEELLDDGYNVKEKRLKEKRNSSKRQDEDEQVFYLKYYW